jgi:hypothetical protein
MPPGYAGILPTAKKKPERFCSDRGWGQLLNCAKAKHTREVSSLDFRSKKDMARFRIYSRHFNPVHNVSDYVCFILRTDIFQVCIESPV